MKNVTELRDSLTDNYEKMDAGTMPLVKGKELANVAGKIINSLKVELEYNAQMKTPKKIKFLEQ